MFCKKHLWPSCFRAYGCKQRPYLLSAVIGGFWMFFFFFFSKAVGFLCLFYENKYDRVNTEVFPVGSDVWVIKAIEASIYETASEPIKKKRAKKKKEPDELLSGPVWNAWTDLIQLCAWIVKTLEHCGGQVVQDLTSASTLEHQRRCRLERDGKFQQFWWCCKKVRFDILVKFLNQPLKTYYLWISRWVDGKVSHRKNPIITGFYQRKLSNRP